MSQSSLAPPIPSLSMPGSTSQHFISVGRSLFVSVELPVIVIDCPSAIGRTESKGCTTGGTFRMFTQRSLVALVAPSSSVTSSLIVCNPEVSQSISNSVTLPVKNNMRSFCLLSGHQVCDSCSISSTESSACPLIVTIWSSSSCQICCSSASIISPFSYRLIIVLCGTMLVNSMSMLASVCAKSSSTPIALKV